MADEPREPRLTTSISMEQKINLGDYQSASVFMAISGVEPGTTAEQIEAALDTTKLAWELMRERMRDRIAETRRAGYA